MKALNEFFVMVLFVLLLKRVHFIANLSKGVTIQMKALNEYSLIVVLMLLLNRVHVFTKKKYFSYLMFNLD